MQYKIYGFVVKGQVRHEGGCAIPGKNGSPGIRKRLLVTPTAAFAFFFCAALGLAGAQEIEAPKSLAPGDPLLCWMRSGRPVAEATAALRDSAGQKLSSAEFFFMPSEGEGYLYGFLLPVPTKTRPGQAFLTVSALVDDGDGARRPIEIRSDFTIEAKKFAGEDIPLDKANTEIRTKPDPAKMAESLSFAEVFASKDLTAVFAIDSMVKPLSVPWRETSGFADERRYLYYNGGSDSTSHGGIDLGALEGSEVLACAPGRVAFAGLRIVTGNTLVLEHLPGLFSIYMHLSSVDVEEGDVVGSGERVGRVGSTGLSTGPHLHWELRIGGVSVNPHYWLSRPLLDKAGLSGKI